MNKSYSFSVKKPSDVTFIEAFKVYDFVHGGRNFSAVVLEALKHYAATHELQLDGVKRNAGDE